MKISLGHNIPGILENNPTSVGCLYPCGVHWQCRTFYSTFAFVLEVVTSNLKWLQNFTWGKTGKTQGRRRPLLLFTYLTKLSQKCLWMWFRTLFVFIWGEKKKINSVVETQCTAWDHTNQFKQALVKLSTTL